MQAMVRSRVVAEGCLVSIDGNPYSVPFDLIGLTAEAALEQALIARFGALGRVNAAFLLRSNNGLVFSSHSHTAQVKGNRG